MMVFVIMQKGETMPRYTDVDALMRLIPTEEVVARMAIANAPIADVVEVVQCKDCKWYKTNYSWNGTEHKVCVIEPYEPPRKECDFCSRGERRDDGENTERERA